MITFNDVYYVATLIEYIGRESKNRRSDVAKKLQVTGINALLESACVNHCISFQQVCDEVMDDYDISEGIYDTVTNCSYEIPSFVAIGKVYARLAMDIETDTKNLAQALYDIFVSGVSDAISDFNSSFFFANRHEILYYYQMEYAG